MVREDRTSPVNPTWTGHRISATCDREFTIVVHMNIVMSHGSLHMHAMQNTKLTLCLSTPWVFSSQTALSTSTRRLAAHIVHALTTSIHPREIQTMWSHNHGAGSYETLCEVDSSSGDVVIYWTTTGTHAVPGRQQDDEHTHQADMVPGGSISYQTVL